VGAYVAQVDRVLAAGQGLFPASTGPGSVGAAVLGNLRAAGYNGRLSVVHPREDSVGGITAYRSAFGRPRAVLGPQPETLGGAELWVVPNPSGLNAHETAVSLAAAYRQAAIAAGVAVSEPAVGGQ